MFSSILSGAVNGIDSYMVHVEVDISTGMPSFDMVGLLGSEVKEARERVRTALRNVGVSLPPKRLTVNLSPANIRKQGAAFDLPIAIGIMCSLEMIKGLQMERTIAIGELGLDGKINPVNGVLPIVIGAKDEGCTRCIVPKGNEQEGAAIEGIEIIGVSHLSEVIGYLRKTKGISPTVFNQQETSDRVNAEYDFRDIQGQVAVKRGLEVAAAGFHNVLMIGPPGAGKTLLAKSVPGILPPLSKAESMEVSKIYSVSGLLHAGEGLIKIRPFVAPHHTATDRALTGGGAIPRPGGVSLAHRGILFLDEIPEFKRATLEVLRQPMEERKVHIARSHGTYTYPSDFILISAMNPCHCGFYPDLKRCCCGEREIHRYLDKVSRPLLDRIDITLNVPKMIYKELSCSLSNESTETIRKRVMQAQNIQQERYKGTVFRFNADIGINELKIYCELGKEEKKLMEDVFEKLNLSARSYHRIIKVARTIADLAGKDKISAYHLSEAIHYKSLDPSYEKR